MDWTITNIILSTAFVSIGSLLQATTGLGAGLIIVPLLSLISIELIPAPMIFGSLALSASMAFYGRYHIDFSNMKPVLGGVVIGTVVAASYISTLSLDKLGLVFGVFILIAVILSIKVPPLSLSTKGCVSMGALSGFMGTSAGVGAPVLALMYQHHTGQSLRATLAFLYFVSSVIMLVLLHFAGRFGMSELISGFLLIPGFVIGYYISPVLVKKIDKGFARPAVLMVSSASAIYLIWRSLVTLKI